MQDFVIPTERVTWGKESEYGVEVRGLSFHDFTQLFMQHGKALDKIFEFIEGGESAASDAANNFDVKEFGVGLIQKSPQLVAQLIALAADSPDRATQVARMPLPVQVKCLEAIYRLTVEEAGGLADFLKLVMQIAREVRVTARAVNPATPLNDIGT